MVDTDECENREEGRGKGRREEGEVGVGGKGGKQAGRRAGE